MKCPVPVQSLGGREGPKNELPKCQPLAETSKGSEVLSGASSRVRLTCLCCSCPDSLSWSPPSRVLHKQQQQQPRPYNRTRQGAGIILSPRAWRIHPASGRPWFSSPLWLMGTLVTFLLPISQVRLLAPALWGVQGSFNQLGKLCHPCHSSLIQGTQRGSGTSLFKSLLRGINRESPAAQASALTTER